MKNFVQIAAGADVMPIVAALHSQPELWNQNTIRTKHPGTAHSEISDILLRFNDIAEFERTGDASTITDDRLCIAFPAWHALPQIRPIIFDLMRRVEGTQLGRAIITRLPVGKSITPHVDGGAPATWFDRYQVALQSLPGCVFHIESEQVQFRSGEVWKINNNALHSVVNNSADDRLVMILDIRSK